MTNTAADYALGLEVDWREQRPSGSDASRSERMSNDWPSIMRSLGCFKTIDADAHRAWIPPLLDHWRDGAIEYFDIAVPAVFVTADQTPSNNNPMAMLATRLAATCGAKAAQSILLGSTDDLRPAGLTRARELFGEIDVPVRRLALSYFSLPTDLWLDPTRIPLSPVEFYLGLLSDGSDAIWNAGENPHACIAGATGSGKTTSAEALLLQHHWKGGRLVLFTAKVGDQVMQQFEPYPQHTVLAGLRGSTLETDLRAVADALISVRAEVERRQTVRAEHGAGSWRDVPPDVRGDASTVLVVFDESRSFFPLKDNREPPEITDIRRQIAGLVDFLAQIARQEDVYLVVMTQSPYVETLASGFVQDQIHLWWTIRKLAPKWLATAYGQSESVNPKMLVNGGLPRGRAVVRGVTAPDNPFGQEAVRDGLMQSVRVSDDVRAVLLSGGPVTAPTTADDTTPGPPDLPPLNSVPLPTQATRGGETVGVETLAVVLLLPVAVLLSVIIIVASGVLG